MAVYGVKDDWATAYEKVHFQRSFTLKRFVCDFRDLPGATIIVKTSFSLFSPECLFGRPTPIREVCFMG